jgi:hypothetical protein
MNSTDSLDYNLKLTSGESFPLGNNKLLKRVSFQSDRRGRQGLVSTQS